MVLLRSSHPFLANLLKRGHRIKSPASAPSPGPSGLSTDDAVASTAKGGKLNDRLEEMLFFAAAVRALFDDFSDRMFILHATDTMMLVT